MKKPYIKLFFKPNNKYFFEPNMDKFVKIGEEEFQYLSDVFAGKIVDKMPEKLQILKTNGYLAEQSKVTEVIHPYTKYIDEFLTRKVHKITLQVTQECNFRCKYCVYSENKNKRQRTHSSKSMSWDIARKSIIFC